MIHRAGSDAELLLQLQYELVVYTNSVYRYVSIPELFNVIESYLEAWYTLELEERADMTRHLLEETWAHRHGATS